MGSSRIVNQACKSVKEITQGDVFKTINLPGEQVYVMFIEWDSDDKDYFTGVVIASNNPRLSVGESADSFFMSDFTKVDSVTICFE